MHKQVVHTDAAPAAVGTYSQAVKVGQTVYLSGQIPLDPVTMKVVTGDFAVRVQQVFDNLAAVCEAAGGSLAHIVKLNIFLLDMADFSIVNELMATVFAEPYPARACVAVKQLPLAVDVEMEAVMVCDDA